jgi:rare lipoprotein A
MNELRKAAFVVALGFLLSGCFGGGGKSVNLRNYGPEVGMASWYGPQYNGNPTASGERFNQNDLTAAHRTLPFGTKVRVTRLDTGRSVVLRINDRGPFVRGRIIDVSKAGAKKLDMIREGVVKVRVEIV